MKAKGVGNKPAPYLLVFTLFLGAVYLSAIFRTGYFCRQEGSEFMAKSKGGVTVSKVWELCQPIVEGFSGRDSGRSSGNLFSPSLYE